MTPRSLVPSLCALLAAACNAPESQNCGDGSPDVGEACLQSVDFEADDWLALGDVDGDGRADAVVVADSSTARIGVQLGQADGTLAPATDGIQGPGIPVAGIGDADGDGTIDVVLWWPGEGDEPGSICGHTLDGAGVLVEQWCHMALQNPRWSDTLFIGALGPAGEPGFLAWTGPENLVVIDPADRAIRSNVDLPINFNGNQPRRIADLDGDGHDTILTIQESGTLQRVGSEGLRSSIEIPMGMDSPVVGDFDGDGIDDVALHSGIPCDAFDAWVRRSTGSTATIAFDAVDTCSELLAGDLDGDGAAELFVPTSAGLLGVWGHQLATDTEPAPELLDLGPLGNDHSGFVVLDLDGNGTDDMLRIAGSDTPMGDTPSGGYFQKWITEIWVGMH